MAEKSYFFDSTEDDKRIYQAADFARFHAQIIGNGVSNTASLPDLKVSATTNMDVSLGAGYMFANGYMYENSDGLKLKHDIADPDNDRIDRVVIRFDNNPEERKIYAVVKKGIPAGKPTPPSVTRDGYIHEMSVAQVRVRAGKSYVDDDDIMDERANDAVCGYIPLHNIYRGLQINELGMIKMPNQSYVEMNDTSGITLSGADDLEEASSDFFYQYQSIVPLIDRQNEIKNGEFHIKENGTYLFSAHARRVYSRDFEDSKKLECFMVINNETSVNDRLYLFNLTVTESQFYGTNVKYLEKGDVVKMVFGRRFINPITLDYIRLNIAKIN